VCSVLPQISFQLVLNGKHQEQETIDMKAIKELEDQKEMLARQCAILQESQRNVKTELDSKSKCIIALHGQAIELEAQVKKISHDFARHVASLQDHCAHTENQLQHLERQLQTPLSRLDGSAKNMEPQVLKDQQLASRNVRETTNAENERKVAELEKRNEELQTVSNQVYACLFNFAAAFPFRHRVRTPAPAYCSHTQACRRWQPSGEYQRDFYQSMTC